MKRRVPLRPAFRVCYNPSLMTTATQNPDALPQLMGEFRPVDEWQAHINELFYGLRGARFRDFYQTFAAADYRLAHALAADYFEKVRERDKRRARQGGTVARSETMTILEWGCGNGNLAACFLTHLKQLDRDGLVYPRVRYMLVDDQPATLDAAVHHPDLDPHRSRLETLCGNATNLQSIASGTVDRIFCNELWSELPTKLMLRKDGEVEEEFIRPNLKETKHAQIEDWAAFLEAFDKKDVSRLSGFPSFLEDIIWEREYRKTEWKRVPYRKTIAEFLKGIDQQVLIPVNVGASETIKEAKRLLAQDAVGFSSFDAGTADLRVLNDPDKPCYGQFGGQYSFMVNFALIEAVARYEGVRSTIETQREFVGRSLGVNVMSLMDLLATHETSSSLLPWQQDRLILRTIHALNQTYRAPYRRAIDFSLSADMPSEEREPLEAILRSLKADGVPDTIAYLTEDELSAAIPDLEQLGYDPDTIRAALAAPPQSIDYYHHFVRP